MSMWPVRRFRDLTLIDSPDGSTIVIACDSVGGIGSKSCDTFTTDARAVTHFAARVPLLEVLAAGAAPTVIVDTLSVEKDPSAIDMIDEIRAMALELGLDPDVSVTGSTEDNVATIATGIGVTVIGIAPAGAFRATRARAGDHVYAVGVPLSAPQDRLIPGDPRMPGIAEVALLAGMDGVHELLPVGSQGIAHEIAQLAQGLVVTAAGPHRIDRAVTSGPSTCVLVAVAPDAAGTLALRDDLPIELVATLSTDSPSERHHS